jgi:hypothetical protein
MARKKKLDPTAVLVTGVIVGGGIFLGVKYIVIPMLNKRKIQRMQQYPVFDNIIQPETIDIEYQNVT